MGELGVESGFEGCPEGRPLLYLEAPFGLTERGFLRCSHLRYGLSICSSRMGICR